MASHDTIIIGAGIVGAACAHRLARDGKKVLILDPGPIGAGATAAGMGHVVVMDDSDAQFALTRYSRDLWDQLAPQLPAEADRITAGTIWVAADADEMAACEAKARWYTQRGVHIQVLDAAGLYHHEPNLRPGLAGGLLVGGDSVVYPPVVAHWLVEQAAALGAVFRGGVKVRRIEPRSVILDGGERIAADVIINAAGAWSTGLTPGLPIRRRKGHLVITDRYPGFCRHQLIELGYLKNAHASDADSVSFNIQPRGTGQMLIGSSRQFDPVDEQGHIRPLSASVDEVMVAKMIRRAAEYMPGISNLSAIRVWTGFRAATPDSLPIIGKHAQTEGLWLATGHEGLGITTSLATAEIVGDLIAGKKPAIAPEPYAPGRAYSH